MRKFTSIRCAALMAVSIAALLSICTKASATVIAAGNFAGFAPPAVTAGGTAAPASLSPLTASFAAIGAGGISGTIDSYVFANDPNNPYTATTPGAFTFVYQIHSTGSPLDRFTITDFTGVQTDVGVESTGAADIIPDKVTRSTGSTLGWNFDGFISAGSESTLLIVRTDSTQFTLSSGNVIDGQVATASIYAPFNSAISPEPASLAFLAGFGALSLRRRQK